jgi:hypothetical protein
VAKYGDTGEVPQALTDYIKGREGYDYNEHGRAGNVHTAFVPDEIVDRFCVLGTANDHIAKLKRRRSASTSSRVTCNTTTRRNPPGLWRDDHARAASTCDGQDVIDVYVAVVISKLARVLHRVVRPLRASSLGDAYVLAWHEWEQSGEAELWESTAADGVPNY